MCQKKHSTSVVCFRELLTVPFVIWFTTKQSKMEESQMNEYTQASLNICNADNNSNKSIDEVVVAPIEKEEEDPKGKKRKKGRRRRIQNWKNSGVTGFAGCM